MLKYVDICRKCGRQVGVRTVLGLGENEEEGTSYLSVEADICGCQKNSPAIPTKSRGL